MKRLVLAALVDRRLHRHGRLGPGHLGLRRLVTHIGTEHYCIATSPSLLGNYNPVKATLHGDLPGLINVNTEYGDDCNPVSNGHAVHTWDATGAAADRYFVLSIL